MKRTRKLTFIRQNVTIDEYNLEKVNSFIHLVVQLTEDGVEVDQIKRQVQVADRAFYFVILSYIDRKAKNEQIDNKTSAVQRM